MLWASISAVAVMRKPISRTSSALISMQRPHIDAEFFDWFVAHPALPLWWRLTNPVLVKRPGPSLRRLRGAHHAPVRAVRQEYELEYGQAAVEA